MKNPKSTMKSHTPLRAKGKKKKVGGRSSAGLKKIENKLVPGLNPPPGDMRSFLAQQRLMYDA